MMKLTLIILSTIALLILIGLFVLAKKSHTAPQLGMNKAQFHSCAFSTNCVNSMEEGDVHIQPFTTNTAHVWPTLAEVVVIMGGDIQEQNDDYLWVTFKTGWMGFVDDMELSLDTQNNVIHVRSASRVGRSDFGVNRKRVAQLRNHIQYAAANSNGP
ncbi:DUF1499 domain-containing protein [Pseudomonadota bacterium]